MCVAVVAIERAIVNLSSPSAPSGAAQAAAPAAAGVLDAEALERLRELDPGGKAGLLARVLATYTHSLQQLLAQLQVARDEGDSQAQRHVAHTLKSSSASVGALTLSALCAEVERQLRDGPMDGLVGQLDQLASEGRRVLAALRQA
jgi:hypothetical protein